MKRHVFPLLLIFIFLTLMFSFMRWREGFVVQGSDVGFESFILISPLLIGLFIVVIVIFLIFISVGRNN